MKEIWYTKQKSYRLYLALLASCPGPFTLLVHMPGTIWIVYIHQIQVSHVLTIVHAQL